jgi:hypothetical protein
VSSISPLITEDPAQDRELSVQHLPLESVQGSRFSGRGRVSDSSPWRSSYSSPPHAQNQRTAMPCSLHSRRRCVGPPAAARGRGWPERVNRTGAKERVGRIVCSRDPNSTGSLLSKFAQSVESGVDLLEAWANSAEQSFAHLCRRDAAGGAGHAAARAAPRQPEMVFSFLSRLLATSSTTPQPRAKRRMANISIKSSQLRMVSSRVGGRD